MCHKEEIRLDPSFYTFLPERDKAQNELVIPEKRQPENKSGITGEKEIILETVNHGAAVNDPHSPGQLFQISFHPPASLKAPPGIGGELRPRRRGAPPTSGGAPPTSEGSSAHVARRPRLFTAGRYNDFIAGSSFIFRQSSDIFIANVDDPARCRPQPDGLDDV